MTKHGTPKRQIPKTKAERAAAAARRAQLRTQPMLAYTNTRGEILLDEEAEPLADAGVIRQVFAADLIPAPPGTVPTLLPGRRPKLSSGRASGRTALAVLLPAGYTRTLLPAYETSSGAPVLPLFGYTFACFLDDELHVAAVATDQREDWAPRNFAPGELEAAISTRRAGDPENRILAQVEICAREYGCFTAQNVFLGLGEAAIPVSPKCNAACVGCISEQAADVGFPSPQTRVVEEVTVSEIVRLGCAHFERVPEGILSFGQGCEGEPLLRSTTIAQAIREIRAVTSHGTINCNTNGSLPKSLESLIDAGLQAVRISINSFRPDVYAAYYRPVGYGLTDVFRSIALALERGLRVSLNLLTHPGVTDDASELEAARAFLSEHAVSLIQTRTLNIDPEHYFKTVGRSRDPRGMVAAFELLTEFGAKIGNFTKL